MESDPYLRVKESHSCCTFPCEFRRFGHDIHGELAGFEESSRDGARVGGGEVARGFEDGQDFFRREASCKTEVAQSDEDGTHVAGEKIAT